MGVFIISPFDKGGRVYDPPQALLDACAPVHPMHYASHWLWSRRAVGPDGNVCHAVSTVSVGASKSSDWDEHFAAAEMYDKVDEVVPPIDAKLTVLRRCVFTALAARCALRCIAYTVQSIIIIAQCNGQRAAK